MTEPKRLDMGDLARGMELLTQATERLGRSYETIARLQRELAEKDRMLAQKTRLEMLGRMSAGLAHEIRNPLGGIRLYTNLLKRDLSDRPAQTETLDKILAAVQNLNRLVEDMLTFGGNLVPQRTAQPVEGVIEDALALARAELEGKRISVTRPAGPRIEVPLDSGMMQRVFLNLILNAVQAMAEGGTLVITLHPEGAGAEIRFQDSGTGIAEPEKIFTPFYTTKAKGTGLGLAIAQKIVEAHGGTIEAANVTEGGARFSVRLPGNPER